MASRPMRNFHVPIPEETYAKLRAQAAKTKRPATGLAREAIEQWLTERERLAVHESIAEYARAVAGTTADLDEVLERSAAEELVRRTKAKRR